MFNLSACAQFYCTLYITGKNYEGGSANRDRNIHSDKSEIDRLKSKIK